MRGAGGALRVGLWLAGVLLPALAAADPAPGGRPDETDLFSAPTPETTPAATSAPADASNTAPPTAPASDSARDSDLLADPDQATQFSREVAPEDPIKLGGQLYLRAQSVGYQGRDPGDWSFATPTLLDTYLDGRPNDRVRGFVQARMSHDPTLPEAGAAGAAGSLSATGSTTGSANLGSLFSGATRAPRVVLDQLWLRFDLNHRVFVTAGKQHVRWGTARFWTPSDFLHVRRRNPLDVFDARTGTSMLKLHVPVESLGWNFYGYAVYENTGATRTLDQIAAAARAEIVLGGSELGLGALVQNQRKPKLSADLSTGIWDFDVYGELALRYGGEIDRVRYNADAMAPATATQAQTIDLYYPVYQNHGLQPQAVGGLTYSRKYNDNDVWTLGAEYFFNALGYGSPREYPGLLLPHSVPLAEPAPFFYLGRHYGALFLSLPAPYHLNKHAFTLSTIGNGSDQSFISRFDYGYTLLTHIRFEAFISARYGRQEGEFRLGVNNLKLGNLMPFSIPAAMVDLGVALRVAI